MQFTTFAFDPPTDDPTPPPWERTPLPLSAQQVVTIHDLDATTELAYGLARAAGASVAILEGRGGYWIACPADLAAYWAEDLRSGRACIVDTVEG
mgnify:FL=1